jgi:hypothetical protein
MTINPTQKLQTTGFGAAMVPLIVSVEVVTARAGRFKPRAGATVRRAVSDERAELESLNEDTFRAEAQLPVGARTWEEYLEDVLDETFVLRRSRADRPDEDKAAMIAAVASTESPWERTLVPDSVRVWSSGALGVVASTVTLPVEDEIKGFANVKVFVRGEDGRWRCVLWHVSPRPPP